MTNLKYVPEELISNVDLIIDSGESILKKASTIIKVENEEIKILREGPISIKELEG